MVTTTHVFTRGEFHELVWSTSLSSLSESFGISQPRLEKMCRQMVIPIPSRSFWANLELGLPVKIAPLRPSENPDHDHIRIISDTFSESDRRRLQTAAATRLKIVRKPPRRTVPQQLKRNKPNIPSNYISGPIGKIHKAVAATAKTLRKAKPDKFGIVQAVGDGLCGIIVHHERAERAILLLHNLALRLSEGGLELIPNHKNMMLKIGPDEVYFTLRERTRREKHVPTKEESLQREVNKIKRDAAYARRDYDAARLIPYRAWNEFDWILTEKLVVAVDGASFNFRKTWADGRTQIIENILSTIVDGLKQILDYCKLHREDYEERVRRSEELDRRRQLSKLRREREVNRLNYLKELMTAEQESRYIRSWLLSTPTADLADEFGRLIAWTKERLQNLESMTSSEWVCSSLKKTELFPDVDSLYDPLGDPPEGSSYG